MTKQWLAVLALSLCSCVKNVETVTVTPGKGIKLLAATRERETMRIPDIAISYEADTDQERTPHIVATGESPLLTADGADFFLAGSEDGSEGFSVDNFLLLEVFSDGGQRLGRAAVGFVNGLEEGKEQIDLMGRGSFKYEPLEVTLASIVPQQGRFKVKATVMDIGGVGSVSDVFIIIKPRASSSDDLRER